MNEGVKYISDSQVHSNESNGQLYRQIHKCIMKHRMKVKVNNIKSSKQYIKTERAKLCSQAIRTR